MTTVIVRMEAEYWNTNRNESSAACCDRPNLWSRITRICADGMPLEIRITARPSLSRGSGSAENAQASSAKIATGTMTRRTRQKPTMIVRTDRAAPRTEARFAGAASAPSSGSTSARSVPLASAPSGFMSASSTASLLTFAASASRSRLARDAPVRRIAKQTTGEARSSMVLPRTRSGERGALKRPRRSGPIRPMNVPIASARFSGSSRNAATASRGPRSMRSLEGARARSRATPAVKKRTLHANELTKMMAEPLEAQSKTLS
mmetsp:Transcript_13448/g.40030  ORF Transcript_13448/g.40030 Transcript_13448/m.40030 type:complete len:263 (+) Transcript_13448:53-841(+)